MLRFLIISTFSALLLAQQPYPVDFFDSYTRNQYAFPTYIGDKVLVRLSGLSRQYVEVDLEGGSLAPRQYLSHETEFKWNIQGHLLGLRQGSYYSYLVEFDELNGEQVIYDQVIFPNSVSLVFGEKLYSFANFRRTSFDVNSKEIINYEHPNYHRALKALLHQGKIFTLVHLSNSYFIEQINATTMEVEESWPISQGWEIDQIVSFDNYLLLFRPSRSAGDQLTLFDLNTSEETFLFSSSSTKFSSVLGIVNSQVFLKKDNQLFTGSAGGEPSQLLDQSFEYAIHNNKFYYATSGGIFTFDGTNPATQLTNQEPDSWAVLPQYVVYGFDGTLRSVEESTLIETPLGLNGQAVKSGDLVAAFADEELWKSDGTLSGTELVFDFHSSGVIEDAGSLFEHGNNVIVRNDHYLSTTGWHAHTDLIPRPAYGETRHVNGYTFLFGDNNAWVLYPGEKAFRELPFEPDDENAVIFNDETYFINGSGDLAKYDGSTISTVHQFLYSDIIGVHDRIFLLVANDIFSSDGTTGGLSYVGTLASRPYRYDLLGEINGKILFVGKNFDLSYVWLYDPVENSFDLIHQCLTDWQEEMPFLVGKNDNVFIFGVFVRNEGFNLYVTDGTIPGTFQLSDETSPIHDGGPTGPGIVMGQDIIFAAKSGEGRELFKTNGLPGSVMQIKDIYPGVFGSDPDNFFLKNNLGFFSATSPQFGRELWVTDGTEAGTQLFQDLNPGIFLSDIDNLISSDVVTLFKAQIGSDRHYFAFRESPNASIFGESQFCNPADPLTFYVENPGGAAMTFNWGVVNATIIGGQGTSVVTIQPSNSQFSVDVSVGWLGESASSNKLVEFITSVPPQPSEIFGPLTVCPSTQQVYSISPVMNSSSYEWEVDGILATSQNESLAVQFGFGMHSIKVRAVNLCGNGPWQEITVQGIAGVSPYAGEDQTTCSDVVQMQAAPPAIGVTGEWSILTGVGGTLSSISDPNADFMGIPGETYQLLWTLTGNDCAPSSDLVNIAFILPSSLADAGPDQVVCGVQTILNGNASHGGVGQWQIVSGDNGFLLDEYDPNTTFYGKPGENYILSWVLFEKPCAVSRDSVEIYFLGDSQWNDQEICGTVGHPTLIEGRNDWLGTWSILRGPDSNPNQFSDIHSASTEFTANGSGRYELVWDIISPDCGWVRQTVFLDVADSDVNWIFEPLAYDFGIGKTEGVPLLLTEDYIYFFAGGVISRTQILTRETERFFDIPSGSLVALTQLGSGLGVYWLTVDSTLVVSSIIDGTYKRLMELDYLPDRKVIPSGSFNFLQVGLKTFQITPDKAKLIANGSSFFSMDGSLFLLNRNTYKWNVDHFEFFTQGLKEFLYIEDGYYLYKEAGKIYWSSDLSKPGHFIESELYYKGNFLGDPIFAKTFPDSIELFLKSTRRMVIIEEGASFNSMGGGYCFFEKDNQFIAFNLQNGSKHDLSDYFVLSKNSEYILLKKDNEYFFLIDDVISFLTDEDLGSLVIRNGHGSLFSNAFLYKDGQFIDGLYGHPVERGWSGNKKILRHQGKWFYSPDRRLWEYLPNQQTFVERLAQPSVSHYQALNGFVYFYQNQMYRHDGSSSSVESLGSFQFERALDQYILVEMGDDFFWTDGSSAAPVLIGEEYMRDFGDYLWRVEVSNSQPLKIFRSLPMESMEEVYSTNINSSNNAYLLAGDRENLFFSLDNKVYRYFDSGLTSFNINNLNFPIGSYVTNGNLYYIYDNGRKLLRISENMPSQIDLPIRILDIEFLTKSGGDMVFVSETLEFGKELAWFDGGEFVVLDIQPGPSSSGPMGIHGLQDRVIFTANHPQTGTETLMFKDGCLYMANSQGQGLAGRSYGISGADSFSYFGVYENDGYQIQRFEDVNIWIPDPILRTHVLSISDQNADSEVQFSEVFPLELLDLEDLGVQWLDGLRYFSNLDELNARKNLIFDLQPLVENPHLGSKPDQLIDLRNNFLGPGSCPSVDSLTQRASVSGATLLLEPQDGSFIFPLPNRWPELTILDLLNGVIEGPSTLNCNP